MVSSMSDSERLEFELEFRLFACDLRLEPVIEAKMLQFEL